MSFRKSCSMVFVGLVALAGCNASVEEIKPTTTAPTIREEEKQTMEAYKNMKPQDMQKMMKEQQEKANATKPVGQ